MVIIVLALIFLVGWAVQYRTKNASWVDVLWAFSTGGLGALWLLSGSGEASLRYLATGAWVAWFGRLGLHLLLRVRGEPEDGRYAYLRSWAGDWAQPLFFGFYLMQAGWVFLFSLPALVVADGSWPPGWAVFLACVIWLAAWLGESLADRQLARFRSNPFNRGLTCRTGLWRYSRHPNYFFEWLQWFAWPLLAMNAPYGGWLWLGPLVVFIFLYYVTGIPFTERQAIRSRGEDYRSYQKVTSMFIPWRPGT